MGDIYTRNKPPNYELKSPCWQVEGKVVKHLRSGLQVARTSSGLLCNLAIFSKTAITLYWEVEITSFLLGVKLDFEELSKHV